MNIPTEFQSSQAMQFVLSRGWNWKQADSKRIEIETCPYCDKSDYGHFYMEIHGATSDNKNRDGLFMCHRCGASGNLYSLKQHLGAVPQGTEWSRDSFAGQQKELEPLPNIETAHQALLEDEAAMDYLINGRGFSLDVIKRQKIGFTPKRYFREAGEVRAILYPYLVNGNCVFVHYRTLPTMPLDKNTVPKAFNSPKGWDAPLYNGEVLNQPGLKDVVFVEGEANTIAAIDHGFKNVCGVPGANFKKAEWIKQLDELALDRIYICYDKDTVGQKAAQTLASRVGVEKCWKIVLPDFMVTTDEGTRPGKDNNEWFAFGGGTAEEFENLKQTASMFDVDGVSSSKDALQELYDKISGKEGLEPKYKPKWPSLAKLVGFDDGDVIDIVAEEKIGKTTFGMNIMEDMVNRYGDDGVIICLEMTRDRLARKWVAHVAQIADNIPKTPEQARALKEKFMQGIPFAQNLATNRPGELYFCYPRYQTTDDIYKLIRDCVRRYGVRWVMLDNLQRLADTTQRGHKNRTEHLSEISKVTSQIAKDYSIQMIRIVQPHAIRDGQIATSRDADGSSQIRKDCDCSISLHRNRVGELSRNDFESFPYVEQEVAFDEKMLTSPDLTRYSSGGYTTLMYDGAMSTVREYNTAEVAKIKAEATKDVGYGGQLQQLMEMPQAQQTSEPQAGEVQI